MPSQESKNNFALMRDKILSQKRKGILAKRRGICRHAGIRGVRQTRISGTRRGLGQRCQPPNFVKVMGAIARARRLSRLRHPAARKDRSVCPPPRRTCFRASRCSSRPRCRSAASRPDCSQNRTRAARSRSKEIPSIRAVSVRPTYLRRRRCSTCTTRTVRRKLRYRGAPKTWQNFMTAFRAAIEENRADGGAGVRFLTETVTSPTLHRPVHDRSRPNCRMRRWYQYEPVNKDNAIAGAKTGFRFAGPDDLQVRSRRPHPDARHGHLLGLQRPLYKGLREEDESSRREQSRSTGFMRSRRR